jgi:hypothetical protein
MLVWRRFLGGLCLSDFRQIFDKFIEPASGFLAERIAAMAELPSKLNLLGR